MANGKYWCYQVILVLSLIILGCDQSSNIEKAREAANEGEDARAIYYYTQAIDEDPENAPASYHEERAASYEAVGLDNSAIREYSIAQRKQSHFKQTYSG